VVRRLRGHRDQVTDLCFLRDDKMLISSSKDTLIKVSGSMPGGLMPLCRVHCCLSCPSVRCPCARCRRRGAGVGPGDAALRSDVRRPPQRGVEHGRVSGRRAPAHGRRRQPAACVARRAASSRCSAVVSPRGGTDKGQAQRWHGRRGHSWG
jgi:hypothetical protein